MKNIQNQNQSKQQKLIKLTTALFLTLLKTALSEPPSGGEPAPQQAPQNAFLWYERTPPNSVSPKTICFMGSNKNGFLGKGTNGLDLYLKKVKAPNGVYTSSAANMDASRCATLYNDKDGQTVIAGTVVSIVKKGMRSTAVTKYTHAADNQYVVTAMEDENLFVAAQTQNPSGGGNPMLYIIDPANLANKVEADLGGKAYDITYVNTGHQKILVSMDVTSVASFYLFDSTNANPKTQIPHNKPKSQIVEAATGVSSSSEPDPQGQQAPPMGRRRRILNPSGGSPSGGSPSVGSPSGGVSSPTVGGSSPSPVFFAAAGYQDQTADIWNAAMQSTMHTQSLTVSVTHLCFLRTTEYMVAAGGNKFMIFKFSANDNNPETVTVSSISNAITAASSYANGGVLALASELDNKIFLYNFLFAKCDTQDCKTCGFDQNDNRDCVTCKVASRVFTKSSSEHMVGSCNCDTSKGFKQDPKDGNCECADSYYQPSGTSGSCVLCDTDKLFELRTQEGPGGQQQKNCTCKAQTFLKNNECVYCNPRDEYMDKHGPSATNPNVDYSKAAEVANTLTNNKQTIDDGRCVCEKGFYPVSDTKCEWCETHTKAFELIGEICRCKKGYYQLGDNCVECHKGCSACTGAGYWKCTECSSDVNYNFLSNSSCISCKILTDHPWCAANISTSLVTKTMASSGGYIDLKMNVSLPNKLSWQARKKIDFSQLYVVSKVNQSSLAFQSQDGSQYNSSAIIPVVSNNDYLEYYYRIRLNDTFKLDDTKKLYIWPAYQFLTRDPGFQMVMTTLEVEVESHGTSSLNQFTRQSFYQFTSKLSQIGITTLLAPALASALANGGVSSFLTYIVKYFQKIQIVENLQKLNIKFGENSEAYYANLETISLPFKKLIHKYLAWSKFIHGDKASQAMKGSNGKLTKDPDNVFMLSDVNWLTTFIICSVWILSTLSDLYADTDDWLKVGLNFVAALLIDLTYYHLQLVSFSEISTSKVERKTWKEILARKLSIPDISVYFAIAFLTFISYDLIKTVSLVISTSSRAHKNLQEGQYQELVEDLRYDKKLLLNKFTHGLDVNRKMSGSLLTIYSTLRYLLIQMVICTLQEMERLQTTLILIIQLFYAFKLFKDLSKKGKTYDSKLKTWKHMIQEVALTIVFFVFLIFAFRQTNEKFMQSGLHAFLETLSLLFLSIFILCEFIMIFYGGWNTTKYFINRYKGLTRKAGSGLVRLQNLPSARGNAKDEGVYVKDLEGCEQYNDSVSHALDEKTKGPYEASLNYNKVEASWKGLDEVYDTEKALENEEGSNNNHLSGNPFKGKEKAKGKGRKTHSRLKTFTSKKLKFDKSGFMVNVAAPAGGANLDKGGHKILFSNKKK